MTHRVVTRAAVFTLALCCVTLAQAATAAASSKSIKAAIVSYGPRIEASEEAVTKAVNEYNASKDPTGVEAALGKAAAVLSSLRAKVAHQSAATARVKRARAKIVNGLHVIAGGYKLLSKAYAEKAASPEAANKDAAHAVALVKSGKRELNQGASLLG